MTSTNIIKRHVQYQLKNTIDVNKKNKLTLTYK